MREYIWETDMAKQIRLEKEYNALQQGSWHHAEFRARYEEKIQDMKDSGMDMPSSKTMCRQYLL